ncbi:hypothetical protein SAMN05216257_10437 [Meinhardsimonia xiamenensis]|jgi:hypothetical protein|uniref:Translocase n=1 Tax=Meinhardsimonia xiamenensis TaxID=990712 RepID=A0A1G9DVH0_9RHOB|nr:hypothetical protein [Meinhardsimonia xiamenensis]PRX31183.1 hypothetical protein LV81_02690 [Meinhardsimonia xiamenensis]SDK67820.1 hypothetical protein SAMN05216257_10437 [Meinhardsimonia xiamenensis]
MLTGRRRLFTAVATVAMASATVVLMAAREYRGAAPPRASTDAATAAIAGRARSDGAQKETAPTVAASAAPIPAAGGAPALPRDPAVTIVGLEERPHAQALKARVEALDVLLPAAAPRAPDAPEPASTRMEASNPAGAEAERGTPETARETRDEPRDAPAMGIQPGTGAVATRQTELARNAYGIPCGPMLSASAAPAAMISLTLSAPCRGGQRVEIAAGPLVFDARIDALGTLRLDVPALLVITPVTARFADDTVLTAEVEAPDATRFERVALLWSGEGAGLQVHALEHGADYGGPGHVWAGAPRGPERALAGRGGFLTRLGNAEGDQARFAEVYTFPSGMARRDGVVRLSIEAEVTARNCGRDVRGETVQPTLGGGLETRHITFAMPECDALGQFLVLKNLLRDLRLATN